jgi:hypothetical protein
MKLYLHSPNIPSQRGGQLYLYQLSIHNVMCSIPVVTAAIETKTNNRSVSKITTHPKTGIELTSVRYTRVYPKVSGLAASS